VERTVQPRGSVSQESLQYDLGLRKYLTGVFAYMGGGLVLSALVAFAMANVAPVTALIFGTPLKWVAIFAPLAVVMFASFSFEPLSVGALQGLFWGFATRLRPASTSPPGAISSSF
jgi:FtsH-binding integral membrane protein